MRTHISTRVRLCSTRSAGSDLGTSITSAGGSGFFLPSLAGVWGAACRDGPGSFGGVAGTGSGWEQGSTGTFGVSGSVTTTHSTTSWMTFSSVKIPKFSPCDATEELKTKSVRTELISLTNSNLIQWTDVSRRTHTRVFGCGVPILHRGGAFGGWRAGFPEDGFVAAILWAGGISEGILGGVRVREHHHLTVLTALCQKQEHCWSHQPHTRQCSGILIFFCFVQNVKFLLHLKRSKRLEDNFNCQTFPVVTACRQN